MSLMEHALLMLSCCSRFKMAVLCLKMGDWGLGFGVWGFGIGRLPAEKLANYVQGIFRQHLVKATIRHLLPQIKIDGDG